MHFDPCARCAAERVLNAEDWRLIRFYQRISDQYTNQTPMGSGSSGPVLTLRMEGVVAALDVYGETDPWERKWLTDGAFMLFRLVHKFDTVNWHEELGKPLAAVVPGDVEAWP